MERHRYFCQRQVTMAVMVGVLAGKKKNVCSSLGGRKLVLTVLFYWKTVPYAPLFCWEIVAYVFITFPGSLLTLIWRENVTSFWGFWREAATYFLITLVKKKNLLL